MQVEAMLEGVAYGGSDEMRDVAVDGLRKHQQVNTAVMRQRADPW